MLQSSNISPILLSLLHKRGLKSDREISTFLSPSDDNFYDPFLLHDMDRLTSRIMEAMQRDERVLIFGDYDVDGISATAILIKYFESKNFYVDYYLPNRYLDGYGLTCETLLKIKEKYNPSLIITVDCGISCYKEVEFARTLNIEVAVTDHHDIPDIIPSGIVVDPKLPNQSYPYKYLCGTGVAFKIVQALAGLEEAKKYLGICAIATIADIVPLLDENRAIVKLGMKDFATNLPLGIKMLFEDNKMPLTSSSTDIAFRLTPKINASGRMGDATIALKLYIKSDKMLLKDAIDTLNEMNIERQALCSKVYNDANERISRINIASYNSIVLYSKDWDSGILGIVASRIAGEYNRPTILLSDLGEELKGSARSINDIDIFEAISSQKEVLVAFGGHKMAAGLTIEKKNFTSFLYHLNEFISQNYTPKDFLPKQNYDYEISLSEITSSLVKEMELLEPTGCDNPKPSFKVNLDDKASICSMSNHPKHLTINSGNLNIVAFSSYKLLPLLKQTKEKSAIIELQENTFRHKSYIKGIARWLITGQIQKIRYEVLYGEYLKQLYFTSRSQKKIEILKDIDKLIQRADKELFGTLFVCSEYSTYSNFCEKIKGMHFSHYLYEVLSNSGLNSVLLCPSNFDNLGGYKNIVFLDPVLSKNYLFKVAEYTSARIYLCNGKNFNKKIFDGLKTDRATFAIYYKAFSLLASSRVNFVSDTSLYKELNNLNKSFNFRQFIFCLYTFIELGIFRIEEEMGLFTLSERKEISSNLESSSFYNQVRFIIKTLH